jgi:hypothetical protein
VSATLIDPRETNTPPGTPTARGYVDAVRPFLAGRVTRAGLDLEHLTAADITAFVVARCPHQAHGSAKLTVTALRSLLGFLHVDGVLPRSLAGACLGRPRGDWPGSHGRSSRPGSSAYSCGASGGGRQAAGMSRS